MSRGRGSPVNLRSARIDQVGIVVGRFSSNHWHLPFRYSGLKVRLAESSKTARQITRYQTAWLHFSSGFGSGVFEAAFDRLAA